MSNGYFDRQGLPPALKPPPFIGAEQDRVIMLGLQQTAPGEAVLPSKEQRSKWWQHVIERCTPLVHRLEREIKLTQEQRNAAILQSNMLSETATEHMKLSAQMRQLRALLLEHYPSELEQGVVDNRPLLEVVGSILLRAKRAQP
jgi:hypothetical protein